MLSFYEKVDFTRSLQHIHMCTLLYYILYAHTSIVFYYNKIVIDGNDLR